MEKIRDRILTWMHTEEKRPGKQQLLVILLIGLLLLVIAIPVPGESDKEQEETKRETSVGIRSGNGTGAEDTLVGQYEAYLEKRVADALECVEGVGKTEVVITLKSSGQKVIEKDQISGSRTTTEEDSAGGTRVEKEGETEKTSIYEQHEDGSRTPYVSREMLPEVEGVAVIAEGGDHPVVVQNITEAIQALFGIEAHKIKIMKRTTAGS